MSRLLGIPFFLIPIFSGFVWLGMLLGMLLWWIVQQHSRRLPSMDPTQYRAYISDIGSTNLQPLFIAMGSVTVVTFDIVFIAERWFRHRGVLAPNTSRGQKVLAGLGTFFAIVGAVGLILLTIFNNLNHGNVHDAMLAVFIGGYIISAIFVCWEYQRLGIHHRQHRVLRISFWIKLMFIFVELGLAIAFGVLGNRKLYNEAAIVEWVISLIYAFYVWSYAIDFLPAVRTKHYASKETEVEMGMAMEQESRQRGYPGGVEQEQEGYTEGMGNGYRNSTYANLAPEQYGGHTGAPNGARVVNNVAYPQPVRSVIEAPSRNF